MQNSKLVNKDNSISNKSFLLKLYEILEVKPKIKIDKSLQKYNPLVKRWKKFFNRKPSVTY